MTYKGVQFGIEIQGQWVDGKERSLIRSHSLTIGSNMLHLHREHQSSPTWKKSRTSLSRQSFSGRRFSVPFSSEIGRAEATSTRLGFSRLALTSAFADLWDGCLSPPTLMISSLFLHWWKKGLKISRPHSAVRNRVLKDGFFESSGTNVSSKCKPLLRALESEWDSAPLISGPSRRSPKPIPNSLENQTDEGRRRAANSAERGDDFPSSNPIYLLRLVFSFSIHYGSFRKKADERRHDPALYPPSPDLQPRPLTWGLVPVRASLISAAETAHLSNSSCESQECVNRGQGIRCGCLHRRFISFPFSFIRY